MASIRIATTHRDRAVLFTPLENSPVIATLRATSVIITDNTFKAIKPKIFTVRIYPINKVEAILVMASAIETTAVRIDSFLILLTIDIMG